MNLKINRLKGFILLTFIGIGLTFFLTNQNFAPTINAAISGPVASRTGAPGEQTCTACHNASANTGQFSIVAPANYTPGATYTIQVKHQTTDATRKRWGFELTALASGAMAGSFANTTANTRTITGSGRTYIEHTTAGTFQNVTSTVTWTFNWTAPASNVGAVIFYASGIQANNNGSESGDQTYVTTATSQPAVVTVVLHHVYSDFDGDGKSDASIYRGSDQTWYVNKSSNSSLTAMPFGQPTDKLTPADFDGDDKTDYAVWREDATYLAGFYILQSSTNTVRFEQFGQTGDIPSIIGDWDGDGKADIGVYRDSAFGNQSYFFYRGSLNNPNGNTTYLPWGTTGDKPMRGDFDGDGKLDAAVYRPSDQGWYILNSSNGQLKADSWGLPTDKFVLGDYDGDSKTDLAVFRNGNWYIKQSSNGNMLAYSWGLATDIPTPADYDGDGKTDISVYRDGNWYSLTSSNSSFNARVFGLSSDVPVPSVYNR